MIGKIGSWLISIVYILFATGMLRTQAYLSLALLTIAAAFLLVRKNYLLDRLPRWSRYAVADVRTMRFTSDAVSFG